MERIITSHRNFILYNKNQTYYKMKGFGAKAFFPLQGRAGDPRVPDRVKNAEPSFMLGEVQCSSRALPHRRAAAALRADFRSGS